MVRKPLVKSCKNAENLARKGFGMVIKVKNAQIKEKTSCKSVKFCYTSIVTKWKVCDLAGKEAIVDSFSLQCFLMLAEQLNFTKAASAMNVSQPTLSRIIANLENEVGATLFNRGKHGISLTGAGQELTVYADSIVRSCEYAVRRARAVENGQGGKLSIGFLPAMCMDFLPVVVQRMKQEYPEVELVLEPHTQDEMIFEMNEGNLDLILMMDSKMDRLINCERRQFYQDEYCVALHREHPLANKEFVEMADLAKERCLFYKRWRDFGGKRSLEAGPLAAQFEEASNIALTNTRTVNDLFGLLTLLECKEGVGLLPTHLKRPGFPDIKFVKIRLDQIDKGFIFRGFMCWRRTNLNPAIETIGNILLEVGGSFSVSNSD